MSYLTPVKKKEKVSVEKSMFDSLLLTEESFLFSLRLENFFEEINIKEAVQLLNIGFSNQYSRVWSFGLLNVGPEQLEKCRIL